MRVLYQLKIEEKQMFTGIVTHLGTIINATNNDSGLSLTISIPRSLPITVGDSISCSGVCLTAVAVSYQSQTNSEQQMAYMKVDVSPETISCTTISNWLEGRMINIEYALALGDRMGGHVVTGHVDGIGHILLLEPVGDYYRMEIVVPKSLLPLIAVKGSITIDGISLTVNEVDDQLARCTVMLIPHTYKHTIISGYQTNQSVHIEVDMFARYVARYIEATRL
jgi:riboflavin synthase